MSEQGVDVPSRLIGTTVVVPIGAGGTAPSALDDFLIGAGANVDVRGIGRRLGLVEPGEVARVPLVDGPDLVYVVVGDPCPNLEFDHVRQAAMAAARRCGSASAVFNAVGCWDDADPRCATAAAEGWVLGAYQYRRDWTVSDLLARLEPAPVRHWGAELPVRDGVVLGGAANLARDLVNAPPGQLPPARLASVCEELGRALGFEVRVHDHVALEREGFGGIVGVGRGSACPPVLVELRRGGDGPHTALVGKGITFDAGGISLKPSQGMLAMKADMSGAAAVLGAFVALAGLRSHVPVRAYLACAENMPGPAATKIGDVLRQRGGRTVEVTNADCEGRLVVADALAYAIEAAPAAIVDLATLTSTTGLGPEIWAGFGTDDALLAQVLAAGNASGEPGWAMPLWAPYRKGLVSDVAESRNFDPEATQPYGAITAALYLEPFAAGVPWAHVDLGLTVMTSGPDRYRASGANGRGVRLLSRFLLAPFAGNAATSDGMT